MCLFAFTAHTLLADIIRASPVSCSESELCEQIDPCHADRAWHWSIQEDQPEHG